MVLLLPPHQGREWAGGGVGAAHPKKSGAHDCITGVDDTTRDGVVGAMIVELKHTALGDAIANDGVRSSSCHMHAFTVFL